MYKKEERQKKELKETIRRYTQWFGMALSNASKVEDPLLKFAMGTRAQKHVNRFKAKKKELERLEKRRVDKPREERQLKIKFINGEFEAKTLARLEQISFGYTEKQIFSELSLSIKRGERIGMIGPNGCGKSTLLKLLAGILTPKTGKVILNPQVRIGYFAQELEGLNLEETLLDSLLGIPFMTQSQARTILGCFLFSNDSVFKKVGKLSMGERCRVAFLKLYFSGANLLILDEPTNYLDIQTREKIEAALLDFGGTVICVSHDRYLLNRITTRIVDLEAELVDFPGSYEEYLENKHKTAHGSSAEENSIKQLQLKLATLMAMEDPQDEAGLLKEIMCLKSEYR